MSHELIDLSTPIDHTLSTTPLTSADEEVLPTYIVDIPCGEPFRHDSNTSHDIFILKGRVSYRDDVYPAGSYISLKEGVPLTAGPKGARLLFWIIDKTKQDTITVQRPEDHSWEEGITQGTQMATLSTSPHKVILTHWEPGAQMRRHNHDGCEDFFILSGEIIDGQDRYPAGSWRRWRTGETHAPQAQTATQVLVINGYCLPDHMSSQYTDRTYIESH